jgi:hypothetical protein
MELTQLIDLLESVIPSGSMLDPGCWTLDILDRYKVRSKNIQHPEASIQYHEAPSRPFDSAA